MSADRQRRPLVLQWRSAVLNTALPSTTKLTLLALAEFANRDGGDCCPGVDSIAKLSSLSERSCRGALRTVEGIWFTRAAVKFAGRDWNGYRYRLVMPEGAEPAAATARRVTEPAAATEGVSTGKSEPEYRQITSRVPAPVADDLGKAPRKSIKEAARKRAPMTTFAKWYETVDREPNKAITDDDPIWDHAEKVGIDLELMHIAWTWFENRYQDDDKQYRDWRAVFRRAVKDDWHRCWRTNRATGALELTEAGLQMQRLMQ